MKCLRGACRRALQGAGQTPLLAACGTEAGKGRKKRHDAKGIVLFLLPKGRGPLGRRLRLEKRGAEIALPGVRQDGDNPFGGPELFGQAQGCRHVGAA